MGTCFGSHSEESEKTNGDEEVALSSYKTKTFDVFGLRRNVKDEAYFNYKVISSSTYIYSRYV